MASQAFVIELIKLWKGKFHQRIALVLISAGAVGLTGSVFQTVLIASIEGFWNIAIGSNPFWIFIGLIALGLWIGWPDIKRGMLPPAHAHDVELLATFRNLIDARTRDFLRDRDFFAPIPRYPVIQLETFNEEWRGALFEFRDAKLQTAFAKFFQTTNAFLNAFQYAVWTIDNNPDFYTVKNRVDQQCGLTPETEEKVARISELARVANLELDRFERLAIDRIGVQ